MLLATLLLIVVAVAIYLAGPKVAVNTAYTVPDLPADLDDYLRHSESKFSDIVQGAEKTIHWADPQTKRRTRYAFVYFHGFSACRQETMPAPARIAEQFDCNIYYARLTGNGRSDDAMAEGTVQTWVNDASEAMAIAEAIGEETIIIGCSTGASLAWWTTHQSHFASQIAALIFFSPNFGLADPRGDLLTIRWGRQIAEKILGKYRQSPSEPQSAEHKKYWSHCYPTKALLPMMALVKVARSIQPDLCEKPVFITYSPYDDTVDADKIQQLYEQLPQPKRVKVFDDATATSQHVIVGDILAPQNTDSAVKEVVAFLEDTVVEQQT